MTGSSLPADDVAMHPWHLPRRENAPTEAGDRPRLTPDDFEWFCEWLLLILMFSCG